MCGNLIYVVFAVFGLVVIDNLCLLVSAIICGFLVYLYVLIFWTNENKNQYIVPLIGKIWDGMSFIYHLWRYIIAVFITVFYSKKIYKMKIIYSDHCTEILSLENEIDTIVLKISQCYLHSWFDDVSEEAEFILYLSTVIKSTLIRLCFKIDKLNRRKVFHSILQLYLHYFIHYIRAKKKLELSCKDFEVKHWATQDKMTEWCYLQSLISSLIDKFGPTNLESSLHSKRGPIIHNFTVEILSEHILYPLTNMITNPSQLNYWLLKILKSYTLIDVDYEYMSTHFQNSPSDCASLSSARILLESEDALDDTETYDNKNVPKYKLAMSKEFLTTDATKCKVLDTFTPSKYYDGVNSNSLSPFISCTKASSNIDLYDDDFLHVREEKSKIGSPVPSDAVVIKRSKSADYIRQMPNLRALSIKDYSFVLINENKMFIAFKPALKASTSSFIEQAEEAVEVPKLFSNIRISDTFQQSEVGILPYTLYCIKYLGVFHDTSQLSEKLQFIKQEVTINRRFREFLALQSRLEDNLSLKTYLRGIKGPSKWLTLPFSNMDKKNIAERKSFLENYLKELCDRGPIAQSAELQEFLAYGGDATLAFVKKGVDINVPRIDKILVRGVKGAIDMFKTAIPNLSAELGAATESSIKLGSEDLILDHRFPEHLLEYSSREQEIRKHLKHSIKNISTVNHLEIEVYPQRASMLRNISPVKAENACQCSRMSDINDESFLEENPLGNCIVDILIECLKILNFKSLYLFSLMKLLVSPRVERYIVSITDGFTEQHLAILLHVLHKALWPEESSHFQNVMYNINHSSNFYKLKQCLEDIVRTTNVILVPCLEVIYVILSSIQYEQLNRCLVFYLYDMIVDYLC